MPSAELPAGDFSAYFAVSCFPCGRLGEQLSDRLIEPSGALKVASRFLTGFFEDDLAYHVAVGW